MTKAGFDVALISGHLACGARIITPNNRLSRTLLEAWGRDRASRGQNVWALPQINSLASWLDTCWQHLLDHNHPASLTGSVISPQQELVLWQQVIRDHCDLPAGSLPRQAQQANAIIQQWRIELDALDSAGPLRTWLEDFRSRLRAMEMITQADRDGILQQAFHESALPGEKRLVLVGFQSHSPLQESLFEAATPELVALRLPSRNKRRYRVAVDNPEAEIAAAASWAKQQLSRQPDARIGIVIPQLNPLRQQVERIFRGRFDTRHWSPEQPEEAPEYFNISAGVPLADAPIVADALELLALNKPRLSIQRYRKLLYSPFWGSGELSETSAKADAWLTEQGDPQPAIGELRYQLRRAEQASDNKEAAALSSALDAVATMRRGAPKSALFSRWVDFFSEQLQLLGWPGARSLSSTEYQQLQQWQQVLNQSVEYDEILGAIPLETALSQLRQLAAEVIFQAEGYHTNLQILGLLEAAAIQFDKLWLVGVDDSQWPSPTRLNPLLPASLQQALKTPRALPEQELRLAENYLRDLTGSAEEIVFSYGLADGERQLQASGLIADIPPVTLEQLSLFELDYPFLPENFAELESLCDGYGPSLAETGEAPIGGTAIFSDQAMCPFNGFARHRLGARNPPEPTLGLSPLERGNILHGLLEQVWSKLDNQQTLLEMDPEALSDLLDRAIHETLQPWRKRRKALFGPRFHRIETQRLKQLLERWLDLEKQRPPFRVQALEHQMETEFAGIPMRLRIDRIDRTEDGRLIVIDYKTGGASIASWLGERPDQPQLPLYTLICSEPVAASSFALVNAITCEFKGIGESAMLLPKLKEYAEQGFADGDQLKRHWRVALAALAEEFKAGYAAAVFNRPSDLNRQTDLLPLNRWYYQQTRSSRDDTG